MEWTRFGFRKCRIMCVLVVFLLLTLAKGHIPVAETACGGTWRSRAPMPTARRALAAAVVNEKIYAIGGFYYDGEVHTLATVEEYDSTTNQWRRRADMPTVRSGLAAVAVSGKIYAIGGQEGDNILTTVEEYDPATNRWQSLAPLSTPRAGLAAAVVNGKIYAIGGYVGLNVTEEYDPTTNQWNPKADMPTPRMDLAAVAIGGWLYAIGGEYIIPHSVMATVEEYDQASNSWRSREDMRTSRAGLAAAVVGERIYSIGGENFNGLFDGTFQILATMEEYDPATNQWHRRAGMPTARSGLAVAVVDGKIYAIGGYSSGSSYLSVVEEYTPPVFDIYKFEYPISSLVMGLLTILLLKKLKKK